MLSKFDGIQQALIASFWALSDAEPPTKRELRRSLRSLTENPLGNVLSVRKAEDAPREFIAALHEVGKAAGKYATPFIDSRVTTGLPSHRQVRVTR